MTIATITHDVNGIRMNIDGVVHSWANQSWLAESHAQSIVRCQRLEAKLKGIGDILNITNIDADEACKRIDKRLGEE
jgi:hypothetical protein